MTPAPPASWRTWNPEGASRYVPPVDTSSPVVSPNHWYFIDLGQGAHATFPGMAQFFEDELELGKRVAYVFDEVASWGVEAALIFSQMSLEHDP